MTSTTKKSSLSHPSTCQIIKYYHTKESRWGYQLVLGGTKHFGYYPDKRRISMRQAMKLMSDKLGQSLNLPSGSKVLDAGCGEGSVALHLAQKFGLQVEGIDLLDFNITKAQQKAVRLKLDKHATFSVGNYLHLQYENNSFDGIYTMETLVHAPDYRAALKEFHRVLKPGGTLVLFEYSMPAQDSMTKAQQQAYATINEGSAMHSFPSFVHDSFPKILKEAGFNDIRVEDITDRMLPMLKRFWQMGVLPYQLIKLFGQQKRFVNTTAGVELYKHRDTFRYNIVIARG